MSATVKIYGQTATIDGWKWTGEDEELVALLNSMLDPNGPSGADPDPGGNEAARVAKELGGEMVSRDPVESEPGVVY